MTIDDRIKELIEEIRICVHKIRMLKATKKGEQYVTIGKRQIEKGHQ